MYSCVKISFAGIIAFVNGTDVLLPGTGMLLPDGFDGTMAGCTIELLWLFFLETFLRPGFNGFARM